MYLYICIYTCTYKQVNECSYFCKYVYVYTHRSLCVCACIIGCVCACACRCVCVFSMCKYISHLYMLYVSIYLHDTCLCHTCLHVCICACVCGCVWLRHGNEQTCMCVCVCVCQSRAGEIMGGLLMYVLQGGEDPKDALSF